MRHDRSYSAEKRNKYLKPLFYSDPEMQFWNSAIYSDAYREKMQKFVADQEKSRRNLVNLIN